MQRIARMQRITTETSIIIDFNADGTGQSNIATGIGFFNHMLEGFAKHGFFDLTINVEGDLEVDGHHTVEDTGIVLGDAISKALDDKKGIKRYGQFVLPMDDALVLCALDLSGRAYLNFDCTFAHERVGYLETCLIKEFFQALVNRCGMNLHIRQLSGTNDHHIIEAVFKAFAKALDEAVTVDPRIQDVLSTKGTL